HELDKRPRTRAGGGGRPARHARDRKRADGGARAPGPALVGSAGQRPVDVAVAALARPAARAAAAAADRWAGGVRRRRRAGAAEVAQRRRARERRGAGKARGDPRGGTPPGGLVGAGYRAERGRVGRAAAAG